METVIEASLGLGEALVSGQVEPDHYTVDPIGDRILSKTPGTKALAIRGRPSGGTIAVTEDAANQQALPDSAIVELSALGRRVARLFGAPQDIEWAWADGKLFSKRMTVNFGLSRRPGQITDSIFRCRPLPGTLVLSGVGDTHVNEGRLPAGAAIETLQFL